MNDLSLSTPLYAYTSGINSFDIVKRYADHVERKVPKYENHKLRERKEKTLTRN